MDFGTIFIALIGFTIALLLFPQFLESMMYANIAKLRELVKIEYPLDRLDENRRAEGQGLWKALTEQDLKDEVKRIRRQRYVPYVTVLIVIEMTIFSYSAYKIARGQRMPGFIEDVVIGLSVLLIPMAIFVAVRVIRNNAFFNAFLGKYESYTALFGPRGS